MCLCAYVYCVCVYMCVYICVCDCDKGWQIVYVCMHAWLQVWHVHYVNVFITWMRVHTCPRVFACEMEYVQTGRYVWLVACECPHNCVCLYVQICTCMCIIVFDLWLVFLCIYSHVTVHICTFESMCQCIFEWVFSEFTYTWMRLSVCIYEYVCILCIFAHDIEF